MSTGYFPACPSVSGGFACHELVLSEERPTAANTIGLAPEPVPPTPESCIIDDNFDRVDQAGLGPNWTFTNWSIDTGQAVLPRRVLQTRAMYIEDCILDPYEVIAKVYHRYPLYNGVGPAASMEDHNNYYCMVYSYSKITIAKRIGGVETQLRSQSVGIHPFIHIGIQVKSHKIRFFYAINHEWVLVHGGGPPQGHWDRFPLYESNHAGIAKYPLAPYVTYFPLDDWYTGPLGLELPPWDD